MFDALEFAAWAMAMEPLADSQPYRNRLRIRDCRSGGDLLRKVCRADRIEAPGRKLVVVYGGSSVEGFKLKRHSRMADFLRWYLKRRESGE